MDGGRCVLMKKQLEVGHLVLGIVVVIGGGLITAGITYQSLAEKVSQVPELNRRMSKMERNIVRIADKVGARIEDPN